MAEIAVIGCGQAGLVVATAFASKGHHVTGIDLDRRKIEACRMGVAPIDEPGLDELLTQGLASGRLTFLDQYPEYPERIPAEFVFIAVGTPTSPSGASDLHALKSAITRMAPALRDDAIVVNKSTVPVGTCDEMVRLLRRSGAPKATVVSNPEFLQEGDAIHNFIEPDRIVLGSNDPDSLERVAGLYEDFGATVVQCDVRTAEMIKYASNAFLAMKVSFINEMASICEVLGADVSGVAHGMGMDRRIGAQFLRAGIGWGGSCFPKDVSALEYAASLHGVRAQLLRGVQETNRDQRRQVLRKLRGVLGRLETARVVVLGASFKPNTSDVRESPALEVASLLRLGGAEVRVVDPHVVPESVPAQFPYLDVTGDLMAAAQDADALVLATEWPEFIDLPLEDLAGVMRRPLIVDGRNVLDDRAVRAAGFIYRCIGRPNAEGGGVTLPEDRADERLDGRITDWPTVERAERADRERIPSRNGRQAAALASD
ncbi:MAG: UDP-glucose/GDP-mannose dehydrogenase family protein [Dehalococcoidia bacterium]|nr:UDP-glucose/GDP-mannose dehydrogenase family protein [Dehalococcoidia bacterium]